MPHYIDGTAAKAGDLVRGKGYNIKDEDGNLKEFAGIVLHVTPGAPACNVTVLVPGEHPAPKLPGMTVTATHDGLAHYGTIVWGRHEYGQCDHFTKIG